MVTGNKEDVVVMEWVDITPKHGVWKPVEVGDELVGKLLRTIPAPYKGRANTKYCFESDHPESINQKIIVYGTYCLNKVLQNPDLINKTLKITYKGESKNTDPLKKPFKKYRIHVQLTEEDELSIYYKDHVDTTANTIKRSDDTEILKIIQEYIDMYRAENRRNPTPEQIVQFAETDPDLESNQLSQIKLVLAKQMKS